LLADLLSLPGTKHGPLPKLSPQRKKQRTFEALIGQLERLAVQQPVAVIFEDAHWADPTSLELLDLIVERVPGLPVLLIMTFRPQFQIHWTGQPQVTTLGLNRLQRRDRIALVEQISGKPLPDEVVDQIIDRSDGVPLFVEELTKSVLESSQLREGNDRYVLDRALSTFAIPTSLQDSLMARLDRLAPARRVAQIGAAIGREFSYELLAAVSRLPEDDLRAVLVALVASELVVQRGTPPNAVYFFKHALVQDAAHNSLLRGHRQQLHGQIADALEIQSPELMERQPELFALHYAEAGLAEKSVGYWSRAARRSITRWAMAEAGSSIPKGPRTRWRCCPKAANASDRSSIFAARWAQRCKPSKGSLHRKQAGPMTARESYGSGWGLLRSFFGYRTGSPAIMRSVVNSRWRIAWTMLYAAGRLASARSHLETGLALYDPAAHRSLVHQVGIGPGVSLHGFIGHVLFALGFVDQGLAQTHAAIAEARTLAHAPSLAAGLMLSAYCHWFLGNLSATAELADETIAIAIELGFPHWRAQGMIYRGWAKLKDGDMTEGMSLLRAVWALTAPLERSSGCRSFLFSWPAPARSRGRLKRRWPLWTRH
jgi:hypothetical protein